MNEKETDGRLGFADRAGIASQLSPYGSSRFACSSLTQLAELSAKATFGPWEVHRVEWTAWTDHVVSESRIRTVGIHPQLKDRSPIISLSTRATKDGPQTGLWILHEDAAFIVAAVNYVRDLLTARVSDERRNGEDAQQPSGEATPARPSEGGGRP